MHFDGCIALRNWDLCPISTMQRLSCLAAPSPFLGAPISNLQPSPGYGSLRQRRRAVVAGDNKRQPNFIDIGAASRGGWDEVKVVRNTTAAPPSAPKEGLKGATKKSPPPRTPVAQVDAKPEHQNLVVEATKRGRGGKIVTVVKGLQLQPESLQALCKSLKTKMGSGGAVKDGEVELQGDHSAKLVEELLKLGYKAKKSGR